MEQTRLSYEQTTEEAQITRQEYPHFIKYMGSKSKIMDFVLEGINEVYTGGIICDLFAGSASLAGAIGQQAPIHSNDIQSYSSILAQAYLMAWKAKSCPSSESIISQAEKIVKKNRKAIGLSIDYSSVTDINGFNQLEKLQQELIHKNFRRPWHLFTKYYSGTWWSLEQCLWIDALRQIADDHKQTPYYSTILASLMFAMAYTSQGTGHYAQYRDANTISSMKDIAIYRKREITLYFQRKLNELILLLPAAAPKHKHKITSLDFKDCLNQVQGGTIYADPPYCFVHYSRFYHALETLVLYDYPEIKQKKGHNVKGRYREDRHQSPFCIKSLVKNAFEDLFKGVKASNSNLVLSYSNTGMITTEELATLTNQYFPPKSIDVLLTNHQHMTLGRQFDRHRNVEECLVLVKQN